MRRVILLLCLCLAGPALGEEGVFVWNDPKAMAIRMIRMGSDDPSTATALFTLQELTSISATMTGVTGDGKSVGLCRQEQDGIESPASLYGFDHNGKQIWRIFAGDLHAALSTALPTGVIIAQTADWFTFSCADAGVGGFEVVAFDVGFPAGKPGADGYVNSDTAQDLIVRIHISGQTGKVLGTALVKDGKSALRRTMPEKLQLYVGTNQVLFFIADGPGVVLPESGVGQVYWNDRPFRWQGKPIVNGFDFAWALPVARPK